MSSTRVYVGNLPDDIRESEVGRLFDRFGRIRSIDIKRSRDGRGGAFAFVDYDHPRDASDAVYERDGYSFDGGRLRVELAKGSRERDRDRDGGRGRGPRGPGFRVRISGLPSSASWQDLKDHMRQAGDGVTRADVQRTADGLVGFVEYSSLEAAEHAVSKLDHSEFRARNGEKAEVRIEMDRAGGGGGGAEREDRRRSRSRSAPRRRSPSPDRRFEDRGASPSREDRRERYDDRERGARYDDRERGDAVHAGAGGPE